MRPSQKLLTCVLLLVPMIATACDDSGSPVTPQVTPPPAAAALSTSGSTNEYQILDISAAVPDAWGVSSVNAAGVVLGWKGGNPSQFAWTEAKGLLTIVAPDGLVLNPDAIDDRGDLAGFTDNGSGQTPWYRPAGGSFQRVPLPTNTLWFYQQRLNEYGELVGGYVTSDNVSTGFWWSPSSGRTDFHSTAPGELVVEFGFNDAREAVGEVEHRDHSLTAFSWSPSQAFSEESYGGDNTLYVDVNDAGTRLLRRSPTSAVLVYADGRRVPLPNPFGDPRVLAFRINADNFVTGAAWDPARGTYIPLVWSPDLQDVVEFPRLGRGIGVGQAINALGDVAGFSLAPDGTHHVVFWKHAATVGGLEAVTTRYVGNSGVAKALISKLEAAAAATRRGNDRAKAGALDAYRHQVSAQTGKSITPAHARELIRLSKRL